MMRRRFLTAVVVLAIMGTAATARAQFGIVSGSGVTLGIHVGWWGGGARGNYGGFFPGRSYLGLGYSSFRPVIYPRPAYAQYKSAQRFAEQLVEAKRRNYFSAAESAENSEQNGGEARLTQGDETRAGGERTDIRRSEEEFRSYERVYTPRIRRLPQDGRNTDGKKGGTHEDAVISTTAPPS